MFNVKFLINVMFSELIYFKTFYSSVGIKPTNAVIHDQRLTNNLYYKYILLTVKGKNNRIEKITSLVIPTCNVSRPLFP